VDIAVPLLANESVHRATVIVLLNYTLESYIKLNMDALAMYTHESAVPGESLFVDGDMTLQMRRPLVVMKTYVAMFVAIHLLALARSLSSLMLSTIQDTDTVCGLATCKPIGDPDAAGLAAGKHRGEVSRPRLYVIQRVLSVTHINLQAMHPQTRLCSRHSTLCGEPTRARTRIHTSSAAFRCR
jgi:hypothetical protein